VCMKNIYKLLTLRGPHKKIGFSICVYLRASAVQSIKEK